MKEKQGILFKRKEDEDPSEGEKKIISEGEKKKTSKEEKKRSGKQVEGKRRSVFAPCQ